MFLINFIIFILPLFHCSHGNPITFLGQTPFRCYISSSQDIGLFLYQLHAVDSSSLEPVSVEYSIVSGNDLGLFVINSTNGIIHSALPLGVSDHTLTVQANLTTDTAMASLLIHVIPSLHQSLLEHTRYNLSIPEDIRVETRISIIRVFSSVQATVTLDGDLRGDFVLNPLNGLLSIARPLDRESIPVYRINLLVQDGTNSQDSGAMLVVIVTDVNDKTPVFHRSFYNVTINDGTLPDSNVTMVRAVDGDEGSNGHVTYSLSGDASSMATFYVDGTTGTIRNSVTLDYEVRHQYQFTVIATDQGEMPRSSYASVLVILHNLADTCPQFTSSLYEIEKTSLELRSLTVPKRLLQVEAFDPDNISDVEYAIQSGNDVDVFQINSTTGVITLLQSDVRGQFELNVSASDGCYTFTAVIVSLGDIVNEYHPTFNSSCQAELEENPAIGTHVITVVAYDNDLGQSGRLTYSFLARTSLFAINETTGVIVTTAAPHRYDRESVAGFELGVLATDGGGLQGFCEMWIALVDINDNAPSFIVNAYSISIRPSFSIGQFVLQVQADDWDMGIHGNVSYSITDPVPFAIDASNGIIVVSQPLISQNYSFHVVARDLGVPPLSSSVSVMVTMPIGEIPAFINCAYRVPMGMNQQICVYNTVIPESTRDAVNITVATNVSSHNVVVVYEALHGTDYRSNSEGTLYIDSSGIILVNTSSVLDYERLSPGPYALQFLVSAHVLPNHTFAVAMVIINVTDVDDSPPRFPAVTLYGTIRENTNANTRVTMVRAVDPDSEIFGRIIYTLHINQTDFAISSSGIVTSLRTFDAETESEFTLIVRAFSNGKIDFASLIISVGDINDNPPFFNQSVYNVTVSENTPVFSDVYHFPITDLDQSDRGRHIYSIVGGNNDGTFSITRSGHLRLQQLLDYDRSSRHNYFLSIQVSDGIFSHEAFVNIQIIDVDDEPPIFTPDNYSAILSEGAPEGTLVVQLIAVDIDSDAVTYKLTGLADGRLEVTANGTILVSGELDREYLPQLQFFAFAIGGEGCIAVATVTITLTDVNDNAPIWFHPFIVAMIQENVDGSTLIATVQACDPDEGHSGTITYHLTDNFDRFLINATTGELTAIVAFDREQMQLISVMVTARDNGTPQLSSQVEVLIEILDVNDNPPFFPYPYMFARVCENASIGQNILFIPAADRDTGSNAAVQFILESSEPNDGRYAVNISTGEVTLSKHIDYEEVTHHLTALRISLVDMGMPAHRSISMAILEIRLLDSNDNRPIPSEASHDVALAEDVSVGSVVLVLTSTDRDSGSNAELTYSIACCSNVFSVITEGNNGLLTIASSLDYESTNMYQLEIVVSDKGRPPLGSNIRVNANVSDVNDNPPQFSQSIYKISIPENVTSVSELIQVSAVDIDTGPGGMIDSYAILTSNEGGGYFTIDAMTGFIGLQGATFDREIVGQYLLTVIAIDRGNPLQLTGSALLLVTISDVNDSPSHSGYMTVCINALDGRFQAGYLGEVYLNDSDSSSLFEECVSNSVNQDLFSVTANCSLMLLEDDPAEGLYELVISGTSSGVAVVTTVMVIVTHVVTPSDLIALTLGVSVEAYLLSYYNSFPILLAGLVGVSEVKIISITPSGRHRESVDIVFTGEELPPVSHMIQQLFLEREVFMTNSIPLVTIPTDACQDDYCLNLGRCVSRNDVTNERVPTVTPTFVYYSVHVISERSCDCGYWSTGSRCETVFDHCYSSPCSNGGVCKNVILDFECECPDGTTGKECRNECFNRECLNGGVCIGDTSPSYCSCPEGYYGGKCQYQYFVDSDYCTPSPCQNGATCSAGRDGFTCHCLQGYSGTLCEQSVVREGGCVSNPCYHNSACTVNATNGFTCTCSVGFTGPWCRWPLNECETKPCGGDVNNCLPGRYGSYLCRCDRGYTGPNCTLPDLCNPNPCLNGGTCDMVADGYTCQCDANYIGTNCEGVIDECVDDRCMHNSSCRDDGLSCDCPSFAAGRYCDVFCPHGNTGEQCEQEIDFCQSNSSICQNGGTCLNTKAGAICYCPPTQFGDHCETTCSDENCANGATCSSSFGICQCDVDFEGPQCELTTVSFNASLQQPTYRAYNTLQFRSLGAVSFQVATRASHGLLLLSIQWDGSKVRDFLSVELVEDGHVSAKMSLGGGTALATVISDVVKINDGRWHQVMLKIQSKELQLLVDHCIDVDSTILSLLDCHSTAVASGNYSSLDLGLPLWIGGAPEILGFSEGTGTSSCISNFTINNKVLDLEDYIDESNSARGCGQLDSCRNGPCEEGTCAVQWEGHQCYVADPVTFTGDGYARYTLLDGGVAKRQVNMEMAFYEESISMRVRTIAEEGLLFQMGGANDLAVLELQDGRVSYSIDTGSGVTMVTGEDYISDAVWHAIRINRVGLSVTMTIDDTNTYSTNLQGDSVILDIFTDEIYAAGHEQAVLYRGCLDDIRFIDQQLPINGTNQFAAVSYIGVSPKRGCIISGPCLSNPCKEGVCQPVSEGIYQCLCNGSACAITSSEDSDDPFVLYVGIAVGAVLILAITTTATFACIYCRHWKYRYGKYTIPSKEHHEMYFVEENMATIGEGQEDGGGEQDIDCKAMLIPNQGIRPSTPEIQAIIMSCKPEADKELNDVDSVRHFAYEGSDCGEGSLSTLCSVDGQLLEQLAQMGPKFDKAKQLLEQLEQEDSDDSEPT